MQAPPTCWIARHVMLASHVFPGAQRPSMHAWPPLGSVWQVPSKLPPVMNGMASQYSPVGHGSGKPMLHVPPALDAPTHSNTGVVPSTPVSAHERPGWQYGPPWRLHGAPSASDCASMSDMHSPATGSPPGG